MSGSRLFQKVDALRRLPPPAVRKATREAAGASQPDCARELHVSVATFSRWEAGRCVPRGESLMRYVDLLDALSGRSAA